MPAAARREVEHGRLAGRIQEELRAQRAVNESSEALAEAVRKDHAQNHEYEEGDRRHERRERGRGPSSCAIGPRVGEGAEARAVCLARAAVVAPARDALAPAKVVDHLAELVGGALRRVSIRIARPDAQLRHRRNWVGAAQNVAVAVDVLARGTVSNTVEYFLRFSGYDAARASGDERYSEVLRRLQRFVHRPLHHVVRRKTHDEEPLRAGTLELLS